MQSKFWFGVLSFAGLALVALAQDEGAEATANKTGVTQVAPASYDAAAIGERDTGTSETALESSADAIIDTVDGAPREATAVTTETVVSSAIDDDNYTPTDRISGDRSVKFPVDI